MTSHYLQARLRNILQEEGISSICSEPPYLLKSISYPEALKDTHPAPFLGKDQKKTFMPKNEIELSDANRVKNWYKQVLSVLPGGNHEISSEQEHVE